MSKFVSHLLRISLFCCLPFAFAGCGGTNQVAPAAISITTATVPSGTVGASYTASFAATAGTTPYTFAATAGMIPTGLSLTSAGGLSGTPTAAGSFSFTLTATDAHGLTAKASYTIVIASGNASALSITTTSLPSGAVNAAYTATVTASGGTSPYLFKLTGGTAPAGINLGGSGTFSGTPTTAGTSNVTVTVTDAAGNTANALFSIVIAPAGSTLVLGPAILPTALAGTAYSASLQANGGTSPYTFTQTGGTLPSSFNLSAGGVLTGTPTTTGTFNFTVKAVDSGNPQLTGTGSYTLLVANASVVVNAGSILATVPQTFFGLHTSVYDTDLNDTAKLPALLSNTGITMLRYPGGNYADRYHWAQFGITPPHASTPPVCGLSPQDVFLGAGSDFGNFLRTVLATGTQPIITVNYGTSVSNSTASLSAGSQNLANHCSEPNTFGQPQEAAAWVAYSNGSTTSTQSIGVDATGFDWKTVGFWASIRAANPLATDDGYNFLRISHPTPIGIKYWEIGNEVYYNGWSNNLNPETDLHAPYLYPGGYDNVSFASRGGLQALSPTAYGTNAAAWIQAMKAVDPTILIGTTFSSPGATDPIPLNWDPDLANSVCGSSNIDLALIHYYPGTYNAVQPGELLSLPQSDLPRQVAFIQTYLKQYCPANASKIQFWLTETSPNGTLAANFPNPVIGLFTLNEYMTSLQTGIQNIDWLELHNGTYLSGDGSETPGPSYFGIQLAHQVAAPGDSVVTATSSSTSIVSYATLKANGQKGVILINSNSSSPATVQVVVNAATVGSTAVESSYGIATTQSGVALSSTTIPISGNSFTVTIPAYTAVSLLIP